MSFFRKTPRFLIVLAVLLVFGFIRGPFEDKLRKQFIEAQLLLPPPGKTTLSQMSQSALIGTLGGLRSVVATALVLFAFEDWSNKDWPSLKRNYIMITNLEPRDESHWVSVIWHMGINATASVQYNESIPAFERERLFNEYAQEAVRQGRSGLEQLPDSVLIRLQLAEVYKEKLKDFCGAAQLYKDMLGLPGCPRYAVRLHGYFLAMCPGKEQEAYDYLMNLYRQGDRHHTASLFHHIKEMEKALGIPFPQRIPDKTFTPPGEKQNEAVLPGGIKIP